MLNLLSFIGWPSSSIRGKKMPTRFLYILHKIVNTFPHALFFPALQMYPFVRGDLFQSHDRFACLFLNLFPVLQCYFLGTVTRSVQTIQSAVSPQICIVVLQYWQLFSIPFLMVHKMVFTSTAVAHWMMLPLNVSNNFFLVSLSLVQAPLSVQLKPGFFASMNITLHLLTLNSICHLNAHSPSLETSFVFLPPWSIWCHL